MNPLQLSFRLEAPPSRLTRAFVEVLHETLSSMPLLFLVFVVMVLGLVTAREAQAQVINYPGGFANSSGQIWLQNGASPLVGPTIQLTTSGIFDAGNNAWYETPVNVQAFTTTFTFTETCSTYCGDGFGFMIISTNNPSSQGFTYSGSAGAQLSWSQCQGTGNTNCLAINSILVKFDLFDVQTDSPGANFTGFYSGGTYPQAPNNQQYDMSGAGINMESGDLFSCTITYDGSTLSETLTDTVTKATYTKTYPGIDVPSLVAGNTAYVGFGGSTGSATTTQSLSSWTYTEEAPGQAGIPTFLPAPGTYFGPQSVTLSTASPGAIVCYSTTGNPATNGATSCASGTVYMAPITVSSGETLYAIAGGTGYNDSPVVSGNYVIQNAVGTPTFSPAAGTYTSAQSVAISDVTSNATIYYTIDGTAPTASSTRYTGPVTVSSTETLKAIAVATGNTTSSVASAAYMIVAPTPVATPVFSPAGGTYTSAQPVTISDATSGATIYYTINGSTPTTSSMMYTAPVMVGSTETLEAIAVLTGSTSAVASASYTIDLLPVVTTPVFSPAGGTYASAQSVTISDVTPGATIYYTTNGTMPTTSSAEYTGAITVSSTETLQAIAALTGDNNSAVGSAAYTITPPARVATPTFSPAAGTYTSAQSVTISDATAGATIYYTTDGTTPGTSSTRYTGPITVGSTQTVEALGVDSDLTDSTVASAVYTITAKPNFTMNASPATLTVSSGDQGNVVLTVTPENGFDAPVNFACSGLPVGATCAFAPATLTPSSAAATTQLTIFVSAQSSALKPGSLPFFHFAELALTVCLFGWRKGRGFYGRLLLVVAYCGVGLVLGCGGNGGTATTPTTPVVPATSTVTVMATSGSLQQTATITLTVN